MKLSEIEDIEEEIKKAISTLEGNSIKISSMRSEAERAEE